MGLTAVQELARILQRMRSRGVNAVWLSDGNMRALSARPGQFFQASPPSPPPAVKPAEAPRKAAPAIQRNMAPPPPPIPVSAGPKKERAVCSEMPVDLGRKIAGMSWQELDACISGCKYCVYYANCKVRCNYIGMQRPKVLFVGDYPSLEECGGKSPFASAAGQMLYKMGVAMGLSWENAPEGKGVAFVNVLKCRPDSMVPSKESMEICGMYLRRQIELAEPTALVLLGALPVKALTQTGQSSFSQIEGKLQDCRGIMAMPIKHPGMIMRFVNQQSVFFEERKRAWLALQELMKLISG